MQSSLLQEFLDSVTGKQETVTQHHVPETIHKQKLCAEWLLLGIWEGDVLR